METTTLELDNEVTLSLQYELVEDEVIIADIQLQQGTLKDLLYWFEGEGFDSLTEVLETKIKDELLTGFSELTNYYEEGDED